MKSDADNDVLWPRYPEYSLIIAFHNNIFLISIVIFCFSTMECLVRILLWSSLVTTWTTVSAQFSRAKFSKKEVFFVNLEEGFFGCQVNETLEVLQIFKIEKLCDGISDCYLGSDENSKELKCSSKYLHAFQYICRTLQHCSTPA